MRRFDWKVTAALAGTGVGLYALASGGAGAMPPLALAACPPAMPVMMRAMGPRAGDGPATGGRTSPSRRRGRGSGPTPLATARGGGPSDPTRGRR